MFTKKIGTYLYEFRQLAITLCIELLHKYAINKWRGFWKQESRFFNLYFPQLATGWCLSLRRGFRTPFQLSLWESRSQIFTNTTFKQPIVWPSDQNRITHLFIEVGLYGYLPITHIFFFFFIRFWIFTPDLAPYVWWRYWYNASLPVAEVCKGKHIIT